MLMPARFRFLALAALMLSVPLRAGAPSHLWRFEEFYSSQDRKVQYIVMREIGGSAIETNLSEHWYATNSFNQDHSLLLGYDLVGNTANKKFLVGTQSYAALAAAKGYPAPDYVLPDAFMNPAGDTVVWWFYQTIVIPPGVMPRDGYHAIRVVDPNIPTSTTVVNQPINFAGQSGTIPLVVPSQSTGSLVLAALLLLASAWFARRALFRPGFARS
jgi:hypothetical protein